MNWSSGKQNQESKQKAMADQYSSLTGLGRPAPASALGLNTL